MANALQTDLDLLCRLVLTEPAYNLTRALDTGGSVRFAPGRQGEWAVQVDCDHMGRARRFAVAATYAEFARRERDLTLPRGEMQEFYLRMYHVAGLQG